MPKKLLDYLTPGKYRMKFSVIIPLYNKASYVKKALESVFAQTYTDFEVIIIDDGSTDNSAEIAKQFITDLYPVNSSTIDCHGTNRLAIPVEIIKQENHGVSVARNVGFSVSIGEYIAFLDADDWWESTFLEKMAQLIEEYPKAGMYACNYYYHKDGRNIVKVDIPTGYFNYPLKYFENFAMPVWTGATILPRNVYNEMNGFPVGVKLGEDFLLWAKIAINYNVVFLNEPLAFYNNTLPPKHRATYKLHKPEEHMLFRLDVLGGEAIKLLNEDSNDWQRLINMLRIHGLYEYWLSDEYHDIAQKELDKVCWDNQHDFLIQMYNRPRWYLKIKQKILRIANRIKHTLQNIKL